jgi:hypothetical protein
MQFSARAYPTLVPADNQIVKSRVIGYDPDGSRAEKANNIAKHMSYQIMHKIPNWEEDMDRLLMVESIVGVCFKKTYRDSQTGELCSKLVFPENLIMNYGVQHIEKAWRKTEVLFYTGKEYLEKVRLGEWKDVGELGDPSPWSILQVPAGDKVKANDNSHPNRPDESTPHVFLAQHTFYDLDEDGYPEPVVIIIHKDTKKVVRVVARFASDSITYAKDGKKVAMIKPLEYFTDFQFLPNPDGSIYGLGFGSLLGPINEAVNSLINQLIDSGTLNNLQSGFIAKGLRLQMKDQKFLPGEWKSVNATGDDLKKSIFPMPTKEPSAVLFQLMNLLIQSGNQLASVAEIMVGKMPGQNTPATTTQETVDQAMKVFTAIYKRNYRALLKEFLKLFRINKLSPDMVEEESRILNIPLQVSDYDDSDDDIIPAADPSGNSSTAQFGQMQQVAQLLMPTGVINNMEYASRMLKLIQIPDPEKLVQQPPPPPPDPKMETEKLKQQTLSQKGQQDAEKSKMDSEAKQQDMQIQERLGELKVYMEQMKLMFKQQDQQMDARAKQQELQLQQAMAHFNAQAEQRSKAVDLQHQVQAGQQKLQHNAAGFKQKQQQQKQQKKQQQGGKPKGGK